jgi:hypothetical protein
MRSGILSTGAWARAEGTKIAEPISVAHSRSCLMAAGGVGLMQFDFFGWLKHQTAALKEMSDSASPWVHVGIGAAFAVYTVAMMCLSIHFFDQVRRRAAGGTVECPAEGTFTSFACSLPGAVILSGLLLGLVVVKLGFLSYLTVNGLTWGGRANMETGLIMTSVAAVHVTWSIWHLRRRRHRFNVSGDRITRRDNQGSRLPRR